MYDGTSQALTPFMNFPIKKFDKNSIMIQAKLENDT